MSEQRTADWHNDRAGKLTGSRFKDVMATGKNGKYLKAREDYIMEIVTERLTGEPLMNSIGNNGDYGASMETYGVMLYEAEKGIMVQSSGFVTHPDFPFVGVSPDGLIGKDGGIESKCPKNSMIHLQTILNNEMPEEHIPQVQGSMWVTGRQWWDFISYDPRMPEHLRLFVQRIQRDDDFIKTLEAEALKFNQEVEAFLAKIPKPAKEAA